MNENTNTPIDEGMETDYLAVINELKANSVDREKYNKLKDENKRLLDTLVSGGQLDQEKATPKETAADLRKALYGSGCDGLSNLDYWDKTLKLRDMIMEDGNPDPFLPAGKNVVATDTDRAAAQKVADTVKHCIEVADGDSLVFTNELQRLTADVNLMRGVRGRR